VDFVTAPAEIVAVAAETGSATADADFALLKFMLRLLA
jgi:hypothetical protein